MGPVGFKLLVLLHSAVRSSIFSTGIPVAKVSFYPKQIFFSCLASLLLVGFAFMQNLAAFCRICRIWASRRSKTPAERSETPVELPKTPM